MNKNPFTPNFGQIPYYVAGREFLINEVTGAFEAKQGHPSLTSIFIGARGSGKTALLSLLGQEAEQRGWITVNVVCLDGMLEDILQQAMIAASNHIEASAKRHLTGFSLAQIISLEWANDSGFEANWQVKMSNLLDKLAEHDIGLLITVDEVDANLDEMIQLTSIYQLFVREGRKVSLLMAGLPSQIGELVKSKSVSFLRRASQYRLDRVFDYEVELAFTKTIEDWGKRISGEALGQAVSAAEGFPYMIQLVGFRMWQEAEADSYITAEHAKKGIALAEKDLEYRVLRATLEELSPGDLKFLAAMLEDENESSVADIEKRLGKSSGYIAKYRRRLINFGVIASPARGIVRLELPGLKDLLPEYLVQSR